MAMKNREQYPLLDDLHEDWFEKGWPEKNELGRRNSKRKMRVVIAFEERDGNRASVCQIN